MSGDSILSRYLEPAPEAKRRQPRGEGADAGEGASGVSETYVSMLDLVFADGRHVGLPYATLVKAEFDPSQGITLRFSTDDVMIEGYRLEPLYRAILQHRAREVRATGRAGQFEKEKDGDGPVVTAIRCEAVS